MSNICFKVNDNGTIINVVYNSSITCKEFMLDFIKRNIGDVPLDAFSFKANGKNLRTPVFLEKKLSDLIRSDQTVNLIRKKSMSYAGEPFGVDMADISNEKGLVKCYYDENAPDWRIITSGLNVKGKCQNSNCRAYGERVDCQIGFGTFDLVGDCDQVRCPMCNKEIEPITCIFDKCQYKIEGKKKANGETQSVNTPWKSVETDYEYYDPVKSGTVRWLKLIIETKPL